MTRKRRRRKQHQESRLSIGNCGNCATNNYVGATNKGLLHRADTGVVKDPHAQVGVPSDDGNCVHDA